MRLTDEELRDVLTRAEELDRSARRGDAWNAERTAVIKAAEEVGLSRQAVERALAERLDLPASPPEVGALTWAQSADGKSYVAEVLSTSDDGAHVRFLRGSDHRLTLDQIRPCLLIPGVRVACEWPMWGPWTCTVIAYDAAKQRVTLSDGWGSTKTFRLSEVWLDAARAPKASKRGVYVRLLGAGAIVGAVVGSIITALLLR